MVTGVIEGATNYLGCGALMVNHYSTGKSVNGLGALKARLPSAFH
jgi:hypothetical protein